MTDDQAKIAEECLKQLEEVYQYLGDKQFLTGDEVCLADFVLYEHCNFAQRLTEGKTWERYPKLEAHNQRMSNLPGLKEYLNSERMHDQPYVFPVARLKI